MTTFYFETIKINILFDKEISYIYNDFRKIKGYEGVADTIKCSKSVSTPKGLVCFKLQDSCKINLVIDCFCLGLLFCKKQKEEKYEIL